MELETTSGQSGREGHAKTFMVKEYAVREERCLAWTLSGIPVGVVSVQ